MMKTPRTIMSLAFSVSALASLSGFGLGLFLPVVVLPPRSKETLIPGLGFGISGCVNANLKL